MYTHKGLPHRKSVTVTFFVCCICRSMYYISWKACWSAWLRQLWMDCGFVGGSRYFLIVSSLQTLTIRSITRVYMHQINKKRIWQKSVTRMIKHNKAFVHSLRQGGWPRPIKNKKKVPTNKIRFSNNIILIAFITFEVSINFYDLYRTHPVIFIVSFLWTDQCR